MKNHFLLTVLKVIAIPIAYALVLRLFFEVDSWSELYGVMSITFLVLLPFGVGIITLYLSSTESATSIGYRLFMPWVPIVGFFILTTATLLEGWACWLMVLPFFLVASSLGGLLGGYLKVKKSRENGKMYVSVLLLLPLFLAPAESIVDEIPGVYKAYTYIDIEAPAQNIWSNVTQVKEIPKKQDKGWLTQLLGFPRPIKAELNFEGEGAYREAIFTNGLVFHETVTEYHDLEKMVFTIQANPHEIPSTTMDEHVVIGGDYFDVLNGTYELEKLDNHTYRLHLYSHFEMTTNFNFYASLWARWIMKDIQNNILQVIKSRAEKE